MSETLSETTGDTGYDPIGDTAAEADPGTDVQEGAVEPAGSAAPSEPAASSWTPSQDEWMRMQQANQAALGVAGQLAPLAQAFQQQNVQSEQDQLLVALQEARDLGDVQTEAQLIRQISQQGYLEAQQAQHAEQQGLRQAEFAFNQEYSRAVEQSPQVAEVDKLLGQEGAGRELLLHLAGGYEFAGQPLNQAVQSSARIIASIVDKARTQAVDEYKASLSNPGRQEPAAGAAGLPGNGKPQSFDDVIATWQNRSSI